MLFKRRLGRAGGARDQTRTLLVNAISDTTSLFDDDVTSSGEVVEVSDPKQAST